MQQPAEKPPLHMKLSHCNALHSHRVAYATSVCGSHCSNTELTGSTHRVEHLAVFYWAHSLEQLHDLPLSDIGGEVPNIPAPDEGREHACKVGEGTVK